jgi:hypothetical protein
VTWLSLLELVQLYQMQALLTETRTVELIARMQGHNSSLSAPRDRLHQSPATHRL